MHGLAEELKVKALPIIEAAAQDENYNYHHFPEGTSLKNTKDCCNQRYGRGPRYGQTENSIEKYTDTFLYMFRNVPSSFPPLIMSPLGMKTISLVFYLLKISQRDSGDRAVHNDSEQHLDDRYLLTVSRTNYEAEKVDYKDSSCVPHPIISAVVRLEALI